MTGADLCDHLDVVAASTGVDSVDCTGTITVASVYTKADGTLADRIPWATRGM